MNAKASSKWSAWQCLLILLAVLFVYAPALAGGWFWDDFALIAGDVDLRTLAGLGSIWSFNADWPLTRTAFWIELHLWDRFPFGYHLTNIALHTANAFLVWKLLSRLGLRWAWLGGLIFAVHPLAVESVAWASELKNTLSLFFALLSLIAWIDLEDGKRGYVRCLLFYTLALLAKTSGLMLPAVFLLYTWWKKGAIQPREIKRTIPFWLVALVLGLVTIHFQSDASVESAAIHARGFFERCLQSGIALQFYLAKFFWPSPLMPIYPARLTIAELLAALSALLVLGLSICRHRNVSRHVLFGLGFFFLTILPILDLADMNYLKFSPVADHFIYLPMIGLVGLSVGAIESLPRRLAPWLAAFVIAVFAWNAHTYAARFADEQQMWTYNIQLNPSAWAAHNNLGYVLLQSGRVIEARGEFETAILINPNSADAHNNLGVALMQTEKYPESIAEFTTALKLQPGGRSAQENLRAAKNKLQSGVDR